MTTIAGDLDIDGDTITAGSIKLDSSGTITLDSATGAFEMHGAGTTAKFADMYAGMILAYTSLLADAEKTYYAVIASYDVPSDVHKISFIAPPSGKVEIETSCWDDVVSAAARALYFGLSSQSRTDGYLTVDVQHEQIVSHPDETDSLLVTTKWVIESLNPGDTITYWIGVKSTHTSQHRLYWGGNSTGEYPPWTIKATALPATIYDGT